MNKVLATAFAAGAFVAASPAMAATEIKLFGSSEVQAGTFGNTIVNSTPPAAQFQFTDDYFFTVPSMGDVGASVISVLIKGGNLVITDFVLNGSSIAVNFDGSTYSASTTSAGLPSIPNPQTLKVKGYLTGTAGAYGGNVTFTAAAVPEPATWALMILGFGVVGYSLRRRPSVRFAQAI